MSVASSNPSFVKKIEQNELEELERLKVRQEQELKLKEELIKVKQNRKANIIELASSLAFGSGIVCFMWNQKNIFACALLFIVLILFSVVFVVLILVSKKELKKNIEKVLDNRIELYWRNQEEQEKDFSRPVRNRREERRIKLRKENDKYMRSIRNAFLAIGILMYLTATTGVGTVAGAACAVRLTVEMVMGKALLNESSPDLTAEPTPEPRPVLAEEIQPEVHMPTYTPIPIDKSQNAFDDLWNDFFAGFIIDKNITVEMAKDAAREIILDKWLDRDFENEQSWWYMEEMDIYGWNAYKEIADEENLLRSQSDVSQLFKTGRKYSDATDMHINNKKAFAERDLGVACLRGADLLMRAVGTDSLKADEKAIAFYYTALLFRQCADNVYGCVGKESFTLYTFSCVCYELAQEYGYPNQHMAAMEKSMDGAL